MLILDRERNQSILIGDNITIRVLGFHNDGSDHQSVKIGIEAPREIIIVRSELLEPGTANPYAVHARTP
jgi:carbon storage regulator CsrA